MQGGEKMFGGNALQNWFFALRHRKQDWVVWMIGAAEPPRWPVAAMGRGLSLLELLSQLAKHLRTKASRCVGCLVRQSHLVPNIDQVLACWLGLTGDQRSK